MPVHTSQEIRFIGIMIAPPDNLTDLFIALLEPFC